MLYYTNQLARQKNMLGKRKNLLLKLMVLDDNHDMYLVKFITGPNLI